MSLRVPFPIPAVCLMLAALAWARPAAAQLCPGPQPETEPNDSPADATPLAPASAWVFFPAPGAIAAPGDVDYFRLTVLAGSRLWLAVDTGGTQTPGATSRDSVLQVFAPDGTTLLEQDDDDGTGNGQSTAVTSLDASVIAGVPLPTAGTYFVRVAAKSPADVIAPYVLMVSLSNDTQAEMEPNDTFPIQFFTRPVVGALSSDSDVDWYGANVLDFGRPWVVVDGDPERDGISTDVVLDFDQFSPPMPQVNSSTGQGAPPPAAESVVLPSLGMVRVSGPAAGSYALGVFYSGDGCPAPVSLQSFAVE